VVITPSVKHSLLETPLTITVLLNDGSELVADDEFIYLPNPRFADIRPRKHLIV